MKRRPYSELLALHIEGFQTFKTAARIQIAPITLLYGPNSAGKSAVHDALELLRKVWSPLPENLSTESWALAPGFNRLHTLLRDWRRNAGEELEHAPLKLGLGARISPVYFIGADALRSWRLDGVVNRRDRLEVLAEVCFSPPANASRLSIRIAVDGIRIYEYVEQSHIAMNAAHPIFFGEGNSLLDANWSLPVELKDGWIRVDGPIHLNGRWTFEWGDWVQDITTKTTRDASWYTARDQFRALHHLLVSRWSEVFAELCSAHLVPASRTVPTPKALQYLFDESLSIPGAAVFSNPESDPQYVRLARGLALELFRTLPEHTEDGEEKVEVERAQRINDCLSTYLYTDRGFRLQVHVFRLASLRPGSGFDCTQGNHIARILLADEQARDLEVEDVGSGLGYALPVLNALFNGQLAFIQQPELHLHPALQTSIADALIAGARSGDTLIVETHSEHLLLRLLRRIRQTVDDKAGEHHLSSKEISVCYFQPSMDGATEVIPLPLSTTGEFTRRWPRGFFVERDQELFGD